MHLQLFVLLDSESIYTKMLTKIAARYGKAFSMDVKVKQMGRNHRDSAQVFIGSEYFRAVSRHENTACCHTWPHGSNTVCLSVCLSMCLVVTTVCPTKMDELVEMPFGIWRSKGLCVKWESRVST